MVVDRSNVDHIMRGLQSTEGVRLHNHRKKLRQRFDIIKKLGQGTYGKVQLGINKETGQEVAIKTIKKCKIETEADLVRIRREIQIMSSVRHPNIIHIYEVFENREKIVLVMEYAAGGELYDYLSERKVLEETEARRIFRQISTAIYYCHKHKICHRDLKLENILLDEHGSAKIADFGLSNVFDGQRLLNTYCGSPLYASPEIVKGTPYHGPEVDCWSLGVLLYTLVYGAMPFDGTNFKRLVKHISQGDYFEPKKASPASPLIRDMLTVNSPDRATIEQICSHWWVNQGFNVSCLDIAEDLANQTPVRLDLLLSLAPPPENTEKIVVTDEQRDLPQEIPPRSMSVGSFMDLDGGNTEERVKSFVAREVPSEHSTGEKTMKRKLEPVPSKSFSGARKKERTKPEAEDEELEKKVAQEPVANETDESAKQMNSNNTVMEIDSETAKPTVPVSKDTVSPKKELKVVQKPSEAAEKPKEKLESPKKESEKTSAETIVKDKPTRKSVKVVKKKVGEKKDSEAKAQEPETGVDDKAKIKKKKTESPTSGAEKEVDVAQFKKDKKSEEKLQVNDEPSSKSPDSTEEVKSLDKEKKEKEKEKTPLPEGGTGTIKAPTERRKSKIFETAEKFMVNDQKSPTQEKPKKVYIPGVKVSDFAKAFERKSSIPTPTLPLKSSPSKKTMSKESSPAERKPEPVKTPEKKSQSPDIKSTEPVEPISSRGTPVQSPRVEKEKETSSPEKKPEEESQSVPVNDEKLRKLKDSAKNVIASALAEEERKKLKKQILKPPVPKTKTEDMESRKKNLTLQIGKETATVQVHTPENTKFMFGPDKESAAGENKENVVEKPKEKKTSKVEITLRSNTLPRRTSKPEVRLSSSQVKKEPANFRTEIEHRIGDPSHVYSTQRSEVAFPVSAATKPIRSMSLEPEGRTKQMPVQRQSTKERIIPIEFEGSGSKEDTEARDRVKDLDKSREGRVKHPYQRTWSLKSNSLSRQSTQDSDTESTVGSTTGEAIKKSPREFIIPIAVEGGGYVTPRATSLEPSESISSKRTSHRPFSRKFSLFSDNGSEDESPFSTLQRHSSRDFDEPFMLHRLRSSRPKPPVERTDSASGSEEEEEDDDGFELLTAENLFSTLLSRVRSLTQRLNVEDGLRPGFPSSRFLTNHFGPTERLFSNLHQPMTRLSDRSDFGRSLSRNENGGSGTGWNRGSTAAVGDAGDSESSGRSHPRGDSKSKRSDSDTESLSESLSLSQRLKGKSSEEKRGRKSSHHHHHHHHQRSHSRTRSMPTCSVVEKESGREEQEVDRSARMWSGKGYERMSLERDVAPTFRYRTEIPKLMRPTSLLLERRQSSQDVDDNVSEAWDSRGGEPKEKDFYDILAEKYGITNVKRYDLPRERRDRRGYQSSRFSCSERRDEKEKSEERDEESEKRTSQKKEETGTKERYKPPSEKLAAVLNRLESRNERTDHRVDGKATATTTTTSDRSSRSKLDDDSGKSRIPKKVTTRHRSDLTLKEYNGLKEREKKEEERWRKEVTPEKSILNKYTRYHSLDEGSNFSRKTANEGMRGPEDRKPKKKYVDKAIRSLRESSVGPQDVASENVLIKRAVSMSDCASPGVKSHQSTVNSVVGMFNKLENNSEAKKKDSDWEKQDGDGSGAENSRIPVSKRRDEGGCPRVEFPVKVESGYHPTPGRKSSNGYLIPDNTYVTPDSESFDSWSICSDLGNPDDVTSKSYPLKPWNLDDLSKESVSDRIRRKSFYTRFNDFKKPRRSSLLSRSYDPECDGDLGRTYESTGRPLYYRSVSTGDDPRPRPFYKSQLSDNSQAPTYKRDSYDWSRNRGSSPSSTSCLRSGSHSPVPYVSLTLPRNFGTHVDGRNYRSTSVYSQRPFSSSPKAESPDGGE